MGQVKVCRICLITDVNMFNLRSYPLCTYFESIIGVHPFSIIEIPPYVCYQCVTLIQKYYNFRSKCIKGQTALYDIIKDKGVITTDNIKHIDREALKLTSNLTKVDQNVTLVINENTAEIKEEPSIDIVNEDYPSFDANTVKEEDIDDYPLPLVLSSDDDEPLIRHKSKKEKKRRTGKKKLEEEVLDLPGLVESESILQVFNAEKHNAPKNKRGRPRKCDQAPAKIRPNSRKPKNPDEIDEQDIEDFCTVIKLSLDEQIAEVNNRKTSSNYQNSVYQCNLCYKGFIDTHAWKNHTAKHEPSAGDVECTICKFRFKNKRQLQKHVSNHERKYACKSCSYISKTSTQAKQHQRWHKGYTYQCQYCDEVSTKWTSHLSHVRIKHPSQFICSVCGYSFVSQLGLGMHKTMMHKDSKREEGSETGPYCEECDVKFQSEEAYKRHMVTSSKHMQHKDRNGCRVCGERFNTLDMLKLHHRQEHSKKRPKNYGKKPSMIKWPTKCEHCSEEILSARDYWAHFRRVHPDKNYPIQKNYVCDICGKSFRGNAFLVYHKRTHSEERAYKCGTCGKAFHNRTNLHTHMKIHSEHRPYPCDVCYKAFKCKGALDRHYRCHTGEKPYECEVCGKSFGQSNSRKLHVRTVHLKQPAPYVSWNRLLKKNKVKEDNLAQLVTFHSITLQSNENNKLDFI
ncbi:hypothetical protein K1T71_009445 [Dendrolimus kikuchii]|uniref:Uncharacterized protein n=1 Tax=Dendrolimus kikuchii TaxID=765133 RepID=A0ACC1CUE3_9NEOP|nr:hypothetical protein K1T71_009445 [Dendrolimus kikuchii]